MQNYRHSITEKQAKKLSGIFAINHDVVPFDEWIYGLNVELEHGRINPLTNITNDDLIMTAKITACHMMEYHEYYKYLKMMENTLETRSKGKKTNIFLNRL